MNPVFSSNPDQLQAGFGEADITPALIGKPAYLAGFGPNRKATAALDPLAVRAVVLRHGGKTVAIACADVVGLFLPTVERVRKELAAFDYVLVSSTHNHHGPDTMGLWGPSPFTSGVDADYLRRVERAIVRAVRDAEKGLRPVGARIGSVTAPELLHDSRPPVVKHDELVAIQFRDPATDAAAGIVVQWNCHPETLDSKNTRISADFVGAAVKELKAKYNCPVVYLTGTVGGLMTSLHVDVRDEQGQQLPEGSAEKMRRYGQLLAAKTGAALAAAKPVRLTPLAVHSRSVALPVDNRRFILGKQLGVLDRPMERWTGDPTQPVTPLAELGKERAAIRTEVAWLRLGELDVAVIPGEIYPELVLGKVQDPPDPAADFPDAPVEPSVYGQLAGPHRMIVGLGNDELGYILPKRQWDEKPPFTHGLTKAPYGEVNSLGPDTGPLLCRVFRDLVRESKKR
ncbi:MAG TPA: hypothetical protein VGF55_32480 [Gemmataceae bacterium]